MKGARSSWLACVKSRTVLLVLLGTALVGGAFVLARAVAPAGVHEVAGVGAVRVETVRDNGPISRCVDLVILGDGYLAEDLQAGGAYERHVERALAVLFAPEPLRTYSDWFNVHVVHVASRERGAAGRIDASPRKTVFGSALEPHGLGIRVLRPELVLRLAELVPGADALLLLVNENEEGGTSVELATGRSVAVVTAGGSGMFSVAHEFGHAFADLADEYVGHQPPYVDSRLSESSEPLHDLPQPNVTLAHCIDTTSRETIRATAKWGHFLALPNAGESIGAFEGGFYRRFGVFRSERLCKMSELRLDFCNVCREAIARRIHDVTGREFDDAAYHAAHPIESR